MNQIINSPLAILALCIIAYQCGLYVYTKTNFSLFNPLCIAISLIIMVLQFGDISMETFHSGGDMITMLLGPATMMLAIPMYKQRHIIRQNYLPIFVGTLVGSITSMGSIYFLCQTLGISTQVAMSLLPKSTTTPIAIEISTTIGGIPAITVASVIITGILGSILFPPIISKFKIKNSIAIGLGIGTASHALGSAKAVEIGETEAALSGIAVGVTGMISVGLALLIQF